VCTTTSSAVAFSLLAMAVPSATAAGKDMFGFLGDKKHKKDKKEKKKTRPLTREVSEQLFAVHIWSAQKCLPSCRLPADAAVHQLSLPSLSLDMIAEINAQCFSLTLQDNFRQMLEEEFVCPKRIGINLRRCDKREQEWVEEQFKLRYKVLIV
jgi:hypothetical protein